MDNGAQRQLTQPEARGPAQQRWSEDGLASDAAFDALQAAAQDKINATRPEHQIGSAP